MKVGASWAIIAFTMMLTEAVHAQIVRDMTPDRIREAISLGTTSKDLRAYRIQEKARWSWPPEIAVYTTPFLRVALAAHSAKKRYQQFTEESITPDMIAPEIHVYATSQAVGGMAIANVQTVVILPSNRKDMGNAIHPIRMSEASQEYKNLFGFVGEGTGMLAVFPLEVWNESNELHVVFDTEIPSSQGFGQRGSCSDCKSRIYMEKIR